MTLKEELEKLTTGHLREEFWRQEALIRKSREAPKDDRTASALYGQARRCLTVIAELLGERYDTDELEMDDKPWHTYL